MLIFLIARLLLSSGEKVPLWTPLGLACLGCLNASFVAQLGTAAGDSSSSPFVLLALYLACLWHTALPQHQARSAPWAVWIGLLMGLAVGLKLTNAPFGLAMVLVLAVLPMHPANKVRQIFLYGLAALCSFAISAGWWFYLVWIKFGNPLFPQFNRLFKSDLAAATSVIDTRWGPVTTLEALAWPFWMSLRPWRIHDALLYNHLWLLVFIVGVLALASHLWRRRQSQNTNTTPALLVLVFVASGYVVWLKVFSIGRYMTVVEMLLPLLLLLGLKSIIWPKPSLILTFTLSFLSLILGLKHSNFGVRAAWAQQSYVVTVPTIQNPASATILIAAGGEPISWLLPHFPSQTAVLRVSGNFPRSNVYDQMVRQTVATRAGQVYAILPTAVDWTATRATQLNARLAASNLAQHPAACKLMGQLIHSTPRYREIQLLYGVDGRCHAQAEDRGASLLHNPNDQIDQGTQELADIGYRLAKKTCHSYPAFVGQMSLPYQFCNIEKIDS
ncbi:hypothetical protein [Rhodoferax sp. BLA1]|uniref:hypothetical protein n=1 Tax=Rhodoferax sp. BLA1 TaxID=2576062 RepID=UPI0015D113D7|nr:hypothetical protein [Rhodoferax sp. BLA1]